MWQKLILCFILLGASSQQDINSHQQVGQIWSYLQLRPDDIYTTKNDSTSIKSLAAEYYGDAKYSPLIFSANQDGGVAYSGDNITTSGAKIILPNIVRCTEFLPLDCIENSHLLQGRSLQIIVTPRTFASPNPFVGRSLQPAGDVDYLTAGDLAQPLMQQVYDSSPLSLQLNVTNLLKVPVWPRDGGKSSLLKAGGEISYDKKVSPDDVTSYRFSFDNFFKKTFYIEVSISIGPMPKYPFYQPGKDTYIQVKVTNALTNANTTYLSSSKIYPRNGSVTILTGTGLNAPNLNITLGIDSKWGQNTAQVIFEDYYGSSLKTQNNEVQKILFTSSPGGFIKQLSAPIWNNILITTSGANNADEGWRFIKVRDNEYRILNMKSTQAVSLNPFGNYFTMETPSVSKLNQVWTLVPAWNGGSTSGDMLYFFQGAGNVCWDVDTTEAKLPNGYYPVRLLPCDLNNASQKMGLYRIKDNGAVRMTVWDWS